MVGIIAQVGTPEAQDAIATSAHVGILRLVKPHAFTLAFVGIGKALGVSMPVITVELNDHASIGHEGINTELIPDEMLRLVVNAELIEQIVPNYFYLSGLLAHLLHTVHVDEHCVALGVGIPASERAVGWVLAGSRRRPTELFAARLTSVGIFVAALPLYLMLKATEVMLVLIQAIAFNVHQFAAPLTRYILTSAAGLKSALWRTEPFAAAVHRLKELTTNFTMHFGLTGGDAFAFARAVFTAALSAGARIVSEGEFYSALLARSDDCRHNAIVPQLNR